MDARVEVDTKAVEEAFDRMQPKNFKTAIRKSLRQGANVIRKSVREVVKEKYPGTMRNLPDHAKGKHFWWHRGKKIVYYKDLGNDVKLGVWKSAKGAFVTLAPNQKNDNRGAIINWLNNGTNPRGNMRSDYEKVKGDMTHRSSRRFVKANGTKNLGRIQPAHFFGGASQGSLQKAQDTVAQGVTANVLKAYKKEQQSSND